MEEYWHLCFNILDASLMFAEPGPLKNVGTQVDCGGVESMDTAIKPKILLELFERAFATE